MATLKKLIRMGADVRQIARLLQAKAPEGHMLATSLQKRQSC